MALVRQTVNNLIGGVSQQPAASRGSDQCTVMDNAWPNPVDGLTRRQPTQFIKTFLASPDPTWKYHFIDRSESEKYLLVFKDSDVDAFDLQTGDVRVVRDIPATGYPYLSGATSSNLDVTTVADYTFVTRKDQVTAVSGTTSLAQGSNQAYIFVRQGNYSTTYTVRVKPTGAPAQQYSITTWDGVTAGTGSAVPVWPSPTKLNSIKTEDIAEQLRLGIENMTGAWNANRPNATGAAAVTTGFGSVVELSWAGGAFDSIDTGDSVGDSVLSVVHEEVPRVAGYLPEICRHGFKVKVTGDAEIDADNYYVSFVADEGAGVFGRGRWTEDVGYGVELGLDPTTMPHILVRRFDDASGTITGTAFQAYFDWDVAPWGQRLTGDTDLVPNPSFVGRAITDVAFFKERLIFVTDDRVVMSETGEPFNFFRTTLLTLRDTAPIDITVNHTPVALLQQAVPYNEALLVKSSRTQFIIRGQDILSPRTVELIPASEFENYGDKDFIPAGRSVFFPFKRGDQSGYREFYQLGDSLIYDAADITAQVPNYIQGEVEWAAISTLEETMVVKAALANVLYVYKYVWAGNRKVLSSWCRWTFDEDVTVREGHFVDNTLYLVMDYGTEDVLMLEKLELASGLVDPSTDWVTHLDRRIDQTKTLGGSYDSRANQSTINLPYDLTNATPALVGKQTGIQYEVVSTGASSITVRGNIFGSSYWIGTLYETLYQFTEPILKVPAGEGLVPATGQATKALKIGVEYHGSGLFQVTNKVGRRTEYTYDIAGPQPDFSSFVVDTVKLQTGFKDVKILGRAEEVITKLISTSPYPMNITSAVWTLNTHQRGRRVSQ